ncbi:MAG: cbb3-type cytochrome c oxidase subunit I [Euryarchaeota archaeon]|nr:cbb3-type cytochrome c oxidase subunit I [Euryarchaeota archaeon]
MDWRRWLTTTNHKDIGILYLVTSLVFFVIGGVLALIFRTQLAQPESTLVEPGLYNQLVTMHGAVMALFFLSPIAFGFANYLVPLQIGASDLAFPRINALSYWTFVLGGLVAASGFALGGAADVGWTFYSPLTNKQYSPGLGVDLAGIGLVLLTVSVVVSTINFFATILAHRRPGLRLYDMPMFTWSIVFTIAIMLAAFPALGGGLLMLVADRHFGTHFFSAQVEGGLVWTHIFWFFGHPEVYVFLHPALGATMEIVPAFSRRPLYGKRYILWSLAIATVLSFIVWVHHMFTTGTDERMREFMSLTTEAISIPFSLIFLCLIATLWRGKVHFRTPMNMALSAMSLFLLGGVTGVFLSSLALDPNFRGTYWVVAHFHFTLVGGTMLMLMAGLYYWYPKFTGRMYNERLGNIHVVFSVIGFLMTFLTMFFISDMPRRIYTYDAASGWGPLNLVVTVGAFVFGAAQALMLFNLLWSLKHGAPAPEDPWRGPGHEWMSSPAPTPAPAPGPAPIAADVAGK